MHSLAVICKVDQITNAETNLQLTDKLWILLNKSRTRADSISI